MVDSWRRPRRLESNTYYVSLTNAAVISHRWGIEKVNLVRLRGLLGGLDINGGYNWSPSGRSAGWNMAGGLQVS